jgi:outer membrane protein OmpA-like peptidoglycan-associated protein
VGLTIGAFHVTITRSDIDASGKAIEDSAFGVCRLKGGVVDLKAGMGGGWTWGVGGPLEGSVTFDSVAKLSPRDFEGACLKEVSVSVLEGSASVFNGAAFGSNYFILSLVNGFELTAVQTDTLSAKTDLTWEITKLKLRDLLKLKLSFNAVVVHAAFTILIPLEVEEPVMPWPDQPGGIHKLSRDVSRGTNILFDYDSAKLMARDEFELRLAVDRRLFTHGEAVAAASGFASPEGRPDYNMSLSQARASAIIQAVRDAFGEALALTKIRGLASGEEAALRAGLLDPPGKTDGERDRILREAASEWPKWRKVELRVEGLLVASVMGRGAGGPP